MWLAGGAWRLPRARVGTLGPLEVPVVLIGTRGTVDHPIGVEFVEHCLTSLYETIAVSLVLTGREPIVVAGFAARGLARLVSASVPILLASGEPLGSAVIEPVPIPLVAPRAYPSCAASLEGVARGPSDPEPDRERESRDAHDHDD